MTDTAMTDVGSFCGQCGQRTDAEPAIDHSRCTRRAELEPPRFCAHCARRMVVQVNPVGWSARCSEHGTITG